MDCWFLSISWISLVLIPILPYILLILLLLDKVSGEIWDSLSFKMERKTIDLDQGWDYMQTGITKLKRILEGLPEPQFDSEQYMMLYT